MVTILTLPVIFLSISNSQGLIFSKIQNICTNEEYLTPYEYPITCCEGVALTPGISFEKFWTSCATPDDSEQYINETLWRVYNCIVQKHLEESGKNNLTLENFAHIMTMHYPAEKRIAIFDRICKSSELAYANGGNLEVLKGIRRKYYEIELQVCAKSNAVSYGKKMMVFPSYEKFYMRGGQCLNSEIPIDPTYYPRASEKDVLDTWKTLLEIVSENDNDKTKGCDIQKVCDLYSGWISNEIATTDEIFATPDFRKMFNQIKPSWANKNVTEILQMKLDEYWITAFSGYNTADFRILSGSMKRKELENRAIKEAEKYFDAKLKFEFFGTRDEPKAKAMMISCMIPNFMKSSMSESFTYLFCRRSSLRN